MVKNRRITFRTRSTSQKAEEVYIFGNISSGEILKGDDLIELRPFNGICIKINEVIGKKLIKDLIKDALDNDCFAWKCLLNLKKL